MEKFLMIVSVVIFAGSLFVSPYMLMILLMSGMQGGLSAFVLIIVCAGFAVFHQKKRILYLGAVLLLILFIVFQLIQFDQTLREGNIDECQKIMSDPNCTISEGGTFSCTEQSENVGGMIPNCPPTN